MFWTAHATTDEARRATVRARAAFGLVLGLALCALLPATANAQPAVALVSPNVLYTFDTTNPSGPGLGQAVTGLGAGEILKGIDVRASDGELYGVTAVAGPALKLYRINPATAVATPVGSPMPLPLAGTVPTGLDFNPVVDRLRYVNTNDENARINPFSGSLAADDPDINPAAADIIAAAYDRNVLGTALTTLYAINRATSSLALIGGVDSIPSPNGGTVTDLGPLGFTLGAAADGGFDVAADGTAYAALTNAADNLVRLYTVNLASGAATAVGTIGTGAAVVDSLALLPAFVPCPSALDIRGCWHLNEAPLSTTAVDTSPFGNLGTYLGNPTLGVPGVRNTAVTLDGVDDLVRVPDSNSLDVGDSFTLEGWVKRSSATQTHTLFNKGASGFQLVVMNAGAGNQVFLRKTNVTTVVRSAIPVLADGNFHHVVATKNGPNSARIYIDGVDSTVPVSGVQVIQNTAFPLLFGSGATTPATFDEFAVYDRALTASEVLTRFNQGAPIPT